MSIGKKAHPKQLRAYFEQTFGEEAEKLLSQWKICHFTREGKTEYDAKWADIGKGENSGVCKNTVSNRLLVVHNSDEELPILQAMMFYHETCHALQSLNGLFGENIKLENFYNNKIKSFRKEGQKAPSSLLSASSSLIHHRHYLKEVHAETFAMAALLAKAETQAEYEYNRNFMLERARDNLWNGAGYSSCVYNFYGSATALAQSFDGDEALRKKFVSGDGSLKLKDLLFYTENIVRENSYTRNEFWAYKRFDRQKQGWDALEKVYFPQLSKEIKMIRASHKLSQPTKQKFLLNMFRDLKRAKSEAEITAVLKGGKSDEQKNFCRSLLKIYRQRKSGAAILQRDDKSR